MLRKVKFAILTLLIALLSCCCFAFVACGGTNDGNDDNNVTKYKITWTVNENLTVVADGYTDLPTELEDGTEVKFTVTPNNGWAVSSVAPSASVKKDGDKYKFTVNKDLDIRVNAREIVESLTVVKPTQMEYYAGDTVNTAGMTVTAHYATDRDAAITDYIIEYQNGGEAFALGDTGFNVTFGGITEEIKFENDKAVTGRISIAMNDGEFTEQQLADLKATFGNENVLFDYDAQKENGPFCHLVFSEPFAEAYTLPKPILAVKEQGQEEGIDFPLRRWMVDGKTDAGIVAKDNAVSLAFEADYETEIVEYHSLSFSTKTITEKVKVTEGEGDDAHEVEKEVEVTIPVFTLTGKFKAATKAQLYLREGNEPVTELFGPEVTRSPDTDDFTLEFDLRTFVRWVNPKEKEEGDEHYKGTLKNAWNDIKLRTVIGGKALTQGINLDDYPENFVNIGDTLEFEVDGVWYQFFYQVWTGDGAIGRDLKLVYQDCPDFVQFKAKLEMTDFEIEIPAEEEGKEPTKEIKNLPAIVINGVYLKATNEKDLIDKASEFIKDAQVLDSWRELAMNKIVEVDIATKSFTIKLSIDDLKFGEVAFFHLQNGNFYNAVINSDTTLDSSEEFVVYRTRLFSGATGNDNTWKNGLVVIELTDPREVPVLPVKTVELVTEGEGENAKLYYVITADLGENTKAAVEACIVNFDLQVNDSVKGGGWDRHTFDDIVVTVDEENKKVIIKIDITALTGAFGYTAHFEFAYRANGAPADLKPDSDAFTGPEIQFNGRKYQLKYIKGSGEGSEYWGCVGLEITEVTPA